MRISDWSSDVCSSDLLLFAVISESPDDSIRLEITLCGGHGLLPCPCPRDECRARPARLSRAARDGGRAGIDRGRAARAAAAYRDRVGARAAALGRRSRRQSAAQSGRSEEHTSELQSLMRTSYAVFCLKQNTTKHKQESHNKI